MNAAEFNRRMAALPEPPNDSRPPYWQYWRHDLWEHAQAEPPENFMTWPCVHHCMLVNHWSMDFQLEQLQVADWPRWEVVIRYPNIGQPPDYHPGMPYSKNLINQAYHLLQWEQHSGRRVGDLSSIVEIGGGYGAMALVCRRLGFTGQYVIYDLPEFSLLQQWFLSQVGVEAECRINWGMKPAPFDLLIGIYSLSETTLDYRSIAMELLSANSYLLVYSQAWQEYDNLAWFIGWTETMPDYEWRHWPMVDENDRPDWYCIGWESEGSHKLDKVAQVKHPDILPRRFNERVESKFKPWNK